MSDVLSTLCFTHIYRPSQLVLRLLAPPLVILRESEGVLRVSVSHTPNARVSHAMGAIHLITGYFQLFMIVTLWLSKSTFNIDQNLERGHTTLSKNHPMSHKKSLQYEPTTHAQNYYAVTDRICYIFVVEIFSLQWETSIQYSEVDYIAIQSQITC